MQKDDRFYTFLLTHSSKNKIYIRRVEISKKFVTNFAASLIFSIGLLSIGVLGLLKSDSIILDKVGAQILSQSENTFQQASFSQNNPNYTETSSINYQRPQTFNTGGPLTLSNFESEAEETEITNRLRLIETTGNPAYLPSMWAHMGKINNEYGFRRNPFGGRTYEFHAGMDIDGEKGDMVVAPANGVVIKADWTGGYGNMIEIDHLNGLTTRYGHLSKIEVAVGETIGRGQLLGLVGSTGRSTGPHLHYELRLNDKAINPRRFLPPEPVEIAALTKRQ
ncbi:MAG TPA: M23 family metallopeptidase [Pyrinomonadaceae bacterium]|jgi:murein DD-endopeptidase MepM/ murein hydrolase activator NlpD